MTQHVADRIIAAVVAQLAAAGIAAVIESEPDNLPAVIIENIEDELAGATGYEPVFETRKLSFDAFACHQVSGIANLQGVVGSLHHDTHFALTGSPAARTLGGLLTRGLSITAAVYRTDTERLEKPIGGWSIHVECTYGLRSDQPGRVEKE